MTRPTAIGHSNVQNKQSTPQTLMDHLHELQSRLFSIGLISLGGAGLGYAFFREIEKIILAPYSKGQDLVYLTPGGAIGFMLQVCAYVGIIFALPAIIFHIYRFVMPAVKQTHLRTVVWYTIASLFLSIVGVVFAYVVSLPASLYFLTSFNLEHINPMLTVDAYFSFVMTYLFAGALLFQLPLIMLIINSVKPLTPKKLMSHQRHMIVGSFIVAAVISPTPDALNQTLLASPVVVMYQVGILLIWLKNRKRLSASKMRERQATPAVVVPRRSMTPSMADYLSENPSSIATTSIRRRGVYRLSAAEQQALVAGIQKGTHDSKKYTAATQPQEDSSPVGPHRGWVPVAKNTVARLDTPSHPVVTRTVSTTPTISARTQKPSLHRDLDRRMTTYFERNFERTPAPRQSTSPFSSINGRAMDGIGFSKRM